MTTKRLLGFGLLVLGLVACGPREDDMALRTFALQRMNGETALDLLTPYIRDGEMVSGRGSLITVRARPDRLEQIAEVIARYDGPPESVRVHIYVLEGGDFDGTSGLAAETTLRELLPYRGYRLLDEASFSTLEWSGFSRDGLGPFAIGGELNEVRGDTGTGHQAGVSIDLAVEGRADDRLGEEIRSTVYAPFGETVVVASHRTAGTGPSLIVALRAERAESVRSDDAAWSGDPAQSADPGR